MKVEDNGKLLASLLAAIGIFAFTCARIYAADAAVPREVPVTINAGETYIINDLSKGSTPAVHVVNNPNALIVHSEAAGQLVLLGAAAGQWSIDVDTAEGEKVVYKVDVKAIASPFSNPLAPGKTPPPLGDPKFSKNGDNAPRASALDPGSGPVEPASASPTAPTNTTASAHKSAPTTPSAGAGFSAVEATRISHPAATAPKPKEMAPASASLMGEPPASPSPAPASIAMNTSSMSKAIDDPSSGAASGPVIAANMSVPAPAGATGGSVNPSQAPSSVEQLPPEKFKSNPPAATREPEEAASRGNNPLPNDVVLMVAGSSHIFDFERRIRRVSIADTEVADLQVINPYQINLIGHKPGFTTLAVWDKQGRYEERQIRVDANGKQQVMLNVIVAELDRSRLEQQGINWSAALTSYNLSAVGLVPGVSTPFSPSTSLTPSAIINPGTANQTVISSTASGTLPPGGSLVPMLLSSNLTYGVAYGGTKAPAQAFFQFLETHNLAKILAQPHLLANSGEKAEFLSGGEIPIVVAQALNTSIVFKQFGTSVIFVPTVVGKDEVELQVKPEVSQPDFAHGVSLFGFTVPAFVTRRAQTFVRLKSNQTFIIAGLILHTKTSQVDKTPYVGDIPYVGNLFKHTSFNDQETDLVMSVTPEVVQPIPSNGEVALPIERGPMTAEEIRTHRLKQTDVSRPRF